MAIMIRYSLSKNSFAIDFFLYTFVYLVNIIMNRHKEPSVITKTIIITFSTNGNVESIEICHRLNIKFGNAIKYIIARKKVKLEFSQTIFGI